MPLSVSHHGVPGNSISPSRDHNHIESSLEKGQNGDSHLLNHTMNDCCFYLKYIDISKDGTHAVLSRNLDERQLDALIDNSPQGKLRLIIAQRRSPKIGYH